eukprot:CAMPEP_0177687386 /NCGR_PEP_ID=MMETSP0447-20121125/34099_1 /TAXON_ID=0 /ORGANISM="Stygamoeba regulata, Strain BSH-02190019" /LENGTH=117 /DNA_ID=CAMNT_0019197621 /DNA_START=27 /DNA_END=377 /DNA_ORIENTATION=-
MNHPDVSELFVVPDGVKKVTMVKDAKIQNAASFTIQKEDHTLGNILRMQLLKDPDVLFAGYRMPHPLDHSIVLKIQTNSQSNPQTALNNAIKRLLEDNLLPLEEKLKVVYASIYLLW